MAESNLTQSEAHLLITMEKQRIDEKRWDYPSLGGLISIPLVSIDKREKFLLDISRKGIDLSKSTYQNRSREIVILLRLDLGKRHRNPDGEEISSNHLHIYREGYGDKWAYPIPEDKFPHLENLYQTLIDFMRYCNITRSPIIEESLFS
ncbi:MAG: hypothetical protein C4527_22770 [Candidatus Omnitrophota bacterium]|nr:MAG: hypothetical protein C4527_22770 [Candidatus Omnitrophota bacterium]